MAAAAVILLANGIVVSAMFAAVPRFARSPARIALGNGLVAQLGSLGTLLGPPLFGGAITAVGWQVAPVLILGFSLCGIALALAAEAAAGRGARSRDEASARAPRGCAQRQNSAPGQLAKAAGEQAPERIGPGGQRPQ